MVLIDKNKLEKDIRNYAETKHRNGETERACNILSCIGILNQQPTVKNTQEWINIEDEKPRMNERVIIFIKSSKGLNSHTTVAKLIDEETFLAGEGYFRFNKVTHWQPLPEEPRENTENGRDKNG